MLLNNCVHLDPEELDEAVAQHRFLVTACDGAGYSVALYRRGERYEVERTDSGTTEPKRLYVGRRPSLACLAYNLGENPVPKRLEEIRKELNNEDSLARVRMLALEYQELSCGRRR